MRAGQPFWRTFFVGDTTEGSAKDRRTPGYGAPARAILPAAGWGVTAPWPLVASAAIGVWLMFAPAILGTGGAVADSERIAGALAIVVAVVSMAEVFRAGRLVNVLVGLWTVGAPWTVEGAVAGTAWNGLIAGALLIVLAVPRGSIRERYGAWDDYIL